MRKLRKLTEDQSLKYLLVIWDYLSIIGLPFLLRPSALDVRHSSSRARTVRGSRFRHSNRTVSLALKVTRRYRVRICSRNWDKLRGKSDLLWIGFVKFFVCKS